MSIVVCLLAAVSSAIGAVSAPSLPAPDGDYAVGVARAEFVDPSRRLDVGDAASGPRRLPAVVWYPAGGRPGGSTPYLDSETAALTLPAVARNLGYTEDELRPVSAARMVVLPGASPVRRSHRFPVVIFSHGFLLYPEQDSVLAACLASRGYIVVSIAHPGDAADVRLKDGRIIATKLSSEGDDPRLARALDTLVVGPDLAVRREALSYYAAALTATRIGRSFAEWRADTLAVARAIGDGKEPSDLHAVLVSADRSRMAFVGMSFGGATAATSCKWVDACRAAVNLDGQNFDPALYDRPVGRPLLLMLSDWTRYGLFKGQPLDEDFSPNDLAYESWSEAGKGRDVVRVRLKGSRHMGFTDLVVLMNGAKREEHVGEIDGREALAATGDLVLAFLDEYVRGGDAAAVERAIERHPLLERHQPRRLQEWMRTADQGK